MSSLNLTGEFPQYPLTFAPKFMKSHSLSPNLFFFGLLVLAAGMPLSKAAMSIGQAILGLSWILAGNYSTRIKSFFNNKSALALFSFFLLHLIGLLYTTDFAFAADSIRIKIPLLVIPFLIFTSEPLDAKKFNTLLSVFIGAVFAGTLISIAVLLGIIKKQVTDIRDISIFISHIRFSLLICISIFLAGYFLLKNVKTNSFSKNILLGTLILWLIVFLVILESVTGLSILTVVLFILVIKYISGLKQAWIRYALFSMLILIPPAFAFYIQSEIKILDEKKLVDTSTLEKYTKLGNLYEYRPEIDEYENGNPVWMYVSTYELGQEWDKRSTVPFRAKDERGQLIEYTIMRFLTSKGLRKDAEGVIALSEDEIKSIERGVANVNYQSMTNISSRIRQILWELKKFSKGGNPSGHSVAQRIEFWRASLGVIENNLLVGVGTGDVKLALDAEYVKINSQLLEEKRLKSHNEYLLVGVTFGITGLLIFLISLFYPMFNENKTRDYFYLVFLCIILLSMLTEDTLETQAGATFFAFFNSIFLFRKNQPPG